MSFNGIDAAGLADLGSRLEFRASIIENAMNRGFERLQRHGRWSAADRVGTRLSAATRVLRANAADFGWRIEAVTRSDHANKYASSPWDLPISQFELAIALPLGVAAGSFGLTRSEVRDLAHKSPFEVAGYFAGQSRAQINLLVATHPELITALDGAPPWARYAASDLLIGERIATLSAEAAAMQDQLADGLNWIEQAAVEEQLKVIGAEAAELRRWLREDRQILLFDPSGDGRVAEVFGDLQRATNIGVVVPGITNDRGNFSVGDGGFRTNAENLHRRSQQLAIGDVATVAWLGYDTPDGADALITRAAAAGHVDLIDFVAGLDVLGGRRHIAVIGHSYGSLVTGLAARSGLQANEVVFVGSPGTGLDHADQANLKPGGVVWAGLAHGDPIGAGVDFSEFLTPEQRVRRSLEQLLDALNGEQALKDLHHGVNPAHEDFGAIEFHTDGASGHSEYFEPETVSLDNLLYIIAGMDDRVSIEIPPEIDLAPGPFGEPWPTPTELA